MGFWILWSFSRTILPAGSFASDCTAKHFFFVSLSRNRFNISWIIHRRRLQLVTTINFIMSEKSFLFLKIKFRKKKESRQLVLLWNPSLGKIIINTEQYINRLMSVYLTCHVGRRGQRSILWKTWTQYYPTAKSILSNIKPDETS